MLECAPKCDTSYPRTTTIPNLLSINTAAWRRSRLNVSFYGHMLEEGTPELASIAAESPPWVSPVMWVSVLELHQL